MVDFRVYMQQSSGSFDSSCPTPAQALALELSFGCPALLRAGNGIDSVLSGLLGNFNL